EPHDGDPGDEIEEAIAVGALDPAALAAHERQLLARVGRQNRRGEDGAHAVTAVTPMFVCTPSRAAVTAARSFGRIPPSSSPPASNPSASSAWIERTTLPPRRRPGTSVRKKIRSARRPTASAAAISSAFTFSGPAASGATTGTKPA